MLVCYAMQAQQELDELQEELDALFEAKRWYEQELATATQKRAATEKEVRDEEAVAKPEDVKVEAAAPTRMTEALTA